MVNGAGAAAIAITKLLLCDGIKNITLCDRSGRHLRRPYRGHEPRQGGNGPGDQSARSAPARLADVLVGADVFIGVSRSGAC